MSPCQVKEKIKSCIVSNDDMDQGIHKGPCKFDYVNDALTKTSKK